MSDNYRIVGELVINQRDDVVAKFILNPLGEKARRDESFNDLSTLIGSFSVDTLYDIIHNFVRVCEKTSEYDKTGQSYYRAKNWLKEYDQSHELSCYSTDDNEDEDETDYTGLPILTSSFLDNFMEAPEALILVEDGHTYVCNNGSIFIVEKTKNQSLQYKFKVKTSINCSNDTEVWDIHGKAYHDDCGYNFVREIIQREEDLG